MLKITVGGGSGHPRIFLDGKLSGDWVNELEAVWNDLCKDRRARDVTLDLSVLTFVDAQGMKLLGSMLGLGAKLQEPQALVKFMLQEFQAGSS